MLKKIAVVILNWNGADMMRQFLPSVVKYSAEAEVIVADNGSTDHSISMLEEEFPEVGIIKLEKNYGFAEGYNKALEQIEAEYSILLNSDVEVTQGWLTPMLDYMETHKEVVACQPKLRAEKQRNMFEYAGAAGGFLDKYGYPFCRGRIFNTVEEDKGQYDTIIPILWATGAALMIRTEAYKQAGGLDGSFFAHMEEIDLCWRLRNRGGKIVCIPQSVVYHVGGATLNKSNPRKTFLNFRNNLLMIYKNASEERVNSILRWRWALDILAMMQMLASGKWKDAQAVWNAWREFNRIKPQYLQARKENLQKTKEKSIPELLNSSILWKYYAKGQKTWNKIC